MLPRGDARLQAALAQVIAEFCFDGFRQRARCVVDRPVPLIGEDDSVHVTAPDSDNRGAAGLALKGDQAKGFLNAGMNKQIGCAIDGREFGGFSDNTAAR